MQLLDWPFLDALQAGALFSLFISFGTDALSRRDRMMGWLSATCLLVGLRHTVLAVGTLPSMNPDLVDRAQSLLVAFGFIALCTALATSPAAFPAGSPSPCSRATSATCCCPTPAPGTPGCTMRPTSPTWWAAASPSTGRSGPGRMKIPWAAGSSWASWA